MTKDNKKGTKPPKHWSQNVHETVISATEDGSPNFTIRGGAENGLFPFVGDIRGDRILVRSGKLHADDILLELNGHKLPGFTLWDVEALLVHIGRAPLHFKTIKPGQTLNKDLRRYLNMRFQKGSVDHDLQQTIRENLYVRTVPCTTRPTRDGEVDGVDYKFLSVDEFMALEKSGHLLESGVFDGNHYGTPKPPSKPPQANSPTSPSSPPTAHPQQNNFSSTSPKKLANHRPGAKPSAPGKRHRNKSTIEATTLNSDPLDEEEQQRREEVQKTEEEFGELPENWEISFTEQGDMYFINHVTETTQWLDPREELRTKKDLLDCDEDELPYGWERIDDPQYGTYFIDHINRKTQYANPVLQAKEDSNRADPRYPSTLPRSARSSQNSIHPPPLQRGGGQENGHATRPLLSTSPVKTTSDAEWRAMFTADPKKLEGEMLKTVLTKSSRGFGFTIVGGDDNEEFLQIKSVVPSGPAHSDGVLRTGDVLVFVKSDATPGPVKVLGYTHQQVVTLFQAIKPGDRVTLEVCRGYPLPFDPEDPNTHIVTSYAISPSANQPPVKIPGTPSSSAFRKHNSHSLDKIHNHIGPPSYKDTNFASRNDRERDALPPPPPKISSGKHQDYHNSQNEDTGSNLSRDTHVKSLPDLTAAKPAEKEVTGSPRAKTPTLERSPKPGSLTLPNELNNRGSLSSDHPSDSPSSTQPEIHSIQFVKGDEGFGFTVADNPYGQKVKQILDPRRCKTLREGDILVEINNDYIRNLPHNHVVNKLKECPLGVETTIVVQRGGMLKPVRSLSKIKPVKTPKTPEPKDKEEGPSIHQFRSVDDREYADHRPHSNGPHRGGDGYSSDDLDSQDDMGHRRHRDKGHRSTPKTERPEGSHGTEDHRQHRGYGREKRDDHDPRHRQGNHDRGPVENGPVHQGRYNENRGRGDHDLDRRWEPEDDKSKRPNDYDRYGEHRRPQDRTDRRLPENNHQTLERERRSPHKDANRRKDDYNDRPNLNYETKSLERKRRPRSPERERSGGRPERSRTPKYDYDSRDNRLPARSPGPERNGPPPIENGSKSLMHDQRGHVEDGRRSRPGGEGGSGPRSRTPKPHRSTSPVNRSDDVIEQRPPSRAKQPPRALAINSTSSTSSEDNFIETTIFLKKLGNGFGFRIIGGREEHSQVAIGNIIANGAADNDGRLVTGDELLYIDGQSVMGASHQEVVNVMAKASQAGRVSLGIRRKVAPTVNMPVAGSKTPVDRQPFQEPHSPKSSTHSSGPSMAVFPYDVTIHRRANEGFGLVILSSTLKSGSKIGRIIDGSPTDRCGKVKVGDRLIAVNKVDIMDMHHKDIVNMIKDAGLSVTLTIGQPEDHVAVISPKTTDSMTNALAMPAHIKTSDTSLLQRDTSREGPLSPVTPTADPYSQHESRYPTAQRWHPPSDSSRVDGRDYASSSRSTPQPTYEHRSPPQPTYEHRSPTSYRPNNPAPQYHNSTSQQYQPVRQHNDPAHRHHDPAHQHDPTHQHHDPAHQNHDPARQNHDPAHQPHDPASQHRDHGSHFNSLPPPTHPSYNRHPPSVPYDNPSTEPRPRLTSDYYTREPYSSDLRQAGGTQRTAPQQKALHHPQPYNRRQGPGGPPSHGTYNDQPEIEPGDYYAVELERGAMGFGFSIRGGREFQNTPLFILRMAEEGPAAQGGLIKIGDEIIEINSHSSDGMLHSEAIEVIRRGGKRVRLLLRRAGQPPTSATSRDGMLRNAPLNVSHSSLQSADQVLQNPQHHQPPGPPQQREPFDNWPYRSLPRGLRY